jgi:uncharacterized protein
MTDATDRQPRRGVLSLLAGLGWVALYVVLIIPVFLGSAYGALWVSKAAGARWLEMPLHGVAWIAGVVLVTWLVRVKLNRRPWSGVGLPPPQPGRLLLGALCGAGVLLLITGVEVALGWVQLSPLDFSDTHDTPRLVWLLLALFPSLGVGLAEDLGFRGYIFQTLAERIPVWAAALLMGLIFGLLHFSLSGFSWSFVVSVILISTMFLTLRFATGSLWFPIGFHGAWDWSQTYLVGLSSFGMKHDPALIHVRQSGPPLWVGEGMAIEGGLLFMLSIALVLALALAMNRQIPWTRRLAVTGLTPIVD